MTRTLHLLTVSFALLFCVSACRSTGNDTESSALAEEVTRLVEGAGQDVSNQDFEAAMEKALHALEISRLREYPLGEVQALYTITGIDIMTSRDADAWEKAVEAENIARKHGFCKELSEILIAKAKLCSYAEISPETGRNDEGLSYAQEALAIGDAINVKILSMNAEKGKISLGLKQNMPEPWSVIDDKYEVGQVISGKVVQIKDYGAFVELEPGLDGLVHISQVSTHKVRHPSEVVQVGDVVKVSVLDVPGLEFSDCIQLFHHRDKRVTPPMQAFFDLAIDYFK